MPRFGAENVPNALQEQMWRQMLKEAMFDKEPTEGGVGLTEFNPNIPSNSVPTGPSEFIPQEWPLGPYNQIRPSQRMNDTKTDAQNRRDNRAMEEGYVYSKTPEVVPPHRNQPRDQWIAPPQSANPMTELYNQMPPGDPNRQYPMQVMPPPDANYQMDQLMQFYTDENI